MTWRGNSTIDTVCDDLDSLCAVCHKRHGEHAGGRGPAWCPGAREHNSDWYTNTVWEPTVYTVEREPAEYVYERLRREDLTERFLTDTLDQ